MTDSTIEAAPQRAWPRHDDTSAHARIDRHEAVCRVRWEQVLARIGRLEAIMIGATGTLLVSMGGIIVTLLLRGS